MADMTWEQCVREVTLASDPKRVAEVGDGWRGLAESLASLRQSLVGQQPYGPYVPGHEPTFSGGLSSMLADWQGSGGDAYREHLQDLGKEIEELSGHASNVYRALTRIEGDIRKSIASIPVPLMDDFGWNEWSLPNGTELDPVGDGSDADGFLAMLRADYAQDPTAYDDRKFREKADDLEATMKIDGKADDNKRGGFWDTDSHLDNWYKDNTVSANSGAAPLPTAVQDERPRLLVPAPDGGKSQNDLDREPPKTGDFGGGGGGGGGVGGGGVGSGFSPGGGGPSGSGYHAPSTSSFNPSTGTSPNGGGSSFHPPSTGAGFDSYPSSSDHDYGTGLAGAGSPSLGGGGGYTGLGSGGGGLGGGIGGGGGFGGGGGGVGSVGGIGGGAGGAGLMGGVPGMVGGGNGKVPPMTSAGTALRNAAGAGAGSGLRGAGGMGMMGGGMGGHGAGPGGGTSEHSSWLTEDDDPWGTDSGAAPGILR